jgi:capsular exopolysaccharide synthesis family protein
LGVIPSGRVTSATTLLQTGARTLLTHRRRLLPDSNGNGTLLGLKESEESSAHHRNGNSNRLALEAWHRRHSGLSESFFAAMNSILFARLNGASVTAFLVTSPELGDGKTTVASNLAIALARIKKRVLLVDGDLRRPSLHDAFGVANETGLIEILAGSEPVEKIGAEARGRDTEVPNLYLLPAGRPELFEPRLMYSSRATELIERLRSEFDVVVIDSPPMLHISDARVLGRLVDGVILVFQAGKTTIDLAMATRNCFFEDGTPVLGTILNNWDQSKSTTYAGHYRTYRSSVERRQRPASS